MPTYKVTDPTSGKTLRLTGDSPPTESELNDIFSSQQTKQETQPTKEQTKKNIPTKSPLGDTYASTGQFLGGLAGGITGGATLGRPILGGILGGVAGRGIGRLEAERQSRLTPEYKAEHPIISSLMQPPPSTISPMVAYGTTFATMTPEQRQNLSSEILKTAGLETVTGAIGGTAVGVGRGILKGVLGKRVAERGIERGWNKILNPEYYKEKIPQEILEKVGSLFPKLKSSTGKGVENLIRTKYKDTIIRTGKLSDKISEVVPKGYTLDTLTDSPAQKKILIDLTNKVANISDKDVPLVDVWETRKLIDDIIDSHSLSENAFRYASQIRSTLNDSIKSAGDDIGVAFAKYAGVMQGREEFGKKFFVAKTPQGELVSPDIESFAKTLLTSSKDEQVRWLKSLDTLLESDDKIIDKFLDYSAAESLQGDVGWSYFTKILMGALGGKRIFPEIGRVAQSLPVKTVAKGTQRTLTTYLTDLFNQNQ